MAEEGVCLCVPLSLSEVVLDVVVGVLGGGRVVKLELLGVEVLRKEIHFLLRLFLDSAEKLRLPLARGGGFT